MATKTLLELLRTPLPEIEYGIAVPLASEPGAACHIHPAGGYHPWSDFSRQVMDLASRQDSGEATFYPPVPFPGKVWGDRGIRSLLYTYWTTPIAQMGQKLNQPLGFGPPDCVPSLVGKPDFVVFPEVETPASCDLIVVAKSRSSLDPHLKAAGLCQPPHPVVSRMFGYLSANCLYCQAPKFGVISSYESSWFCVLSHDRMLVSDPVRAEDTSPGVLACLWYVLSMAVVGRSVTTLPVLPVVEPGFSTSALVASCMTSFHLPDRYLRVMDYDAVVLGDRIHIGTNSLVYQSSYQGSDAVIKCLDVSQCGTSKLASYLRELHAYESNLKQLQGSAIPKLLDAGFLHGTMFFLLILSDEGEAVERVPPSERGDCFMQARLALESIHKLGVVHGDVSLSNVCCRDDWSTRWVDLETTRPGTQQEMQDEFDKLYYAFYPEAATDLDQLM